MALYPSLEDMKVDQMARAQISYESQFPPLSAPTPQVQSSPTHVTMPMPYGREPSVLYPALNDFMGLEFTPEVIAENMPEYAAQSQIAVRPSLNVATTNGGPLSGMIAPLSGDSLGLQRAQVTHGVRQLTLCKDAEGKIGLRVKPINKGVFVCLVTAGSPAAMAGLRFGDQILEINGTVVAGFSMDQVHDLFRKSPVNGISVVVRDRPFERTVTLHKDSTRHIGFQFKNGKIVGLVKDSSAARNGLLTEHHLLEVNGQNVVGMKDKDITAIINDGGNVITVTIIPSFVYEHMIKKMSGSLLKSIMDHSIPGM